MKAFKQKKGTPLLKFLLSKEWIGVEPTNDGFADQSLTAWVPLQKNVWLLYQKSLNMSIALAKAVTLHSCQLILPSLIVLQRQNYAFCGIRVYSLP